MDARAGDFWRSAPTLTIVIPALNEEAAIGDTIERCLQARESIQSESGVRQVTIVVVSDGSTDRTLEIASTYDGVELIEFKTNRGYGAAIKEGWKQHSADLLAFLDADGTCDPLVFGELCRATLNESADVVLGSRMGPDSKMPAIRRLGNRIFATLLGFLCGKQITDTASGMRVVQQRSLQHLYPLPDGLHFTPSMSARALLNDLRVVEVPMTYEERVGASKLHAFRDGIRFLKTIFSGVLNYRPEGILSWAFVACLTGVMLLAAFPVEFYFRNWRLEEWMIYRFVACQLMASVGLSLLLAVALLHRLSYFGPRRQAANGFWPALVAGLFSGWRLAAVAVGLLLTAVFFLWPGIVQYLSTAHTDLHWSRLIAGAFALFSGTQCLLFGVLFNVISQWIEQLHLKHQQLQTQHDAGLGERELSGAKY